MTRVLVFGTFDVLHQGHLDFLRQAKELGTELHVVIARDATAEKVKGKSPSQPERERLQAVQEVEFVKQAHLGQKGDKYAVIEAISPDIIALGYDQVAFTDNLSTELQKRGLNPKIVRLNPFHPQIYKSSIINRQKA